MNKNLTIKACMSDCSTHWIYSNVMKVKLKWLYDWVFVKCNTITTKVKVLPREQHTKVPLSKTKTEINHLINKSFLNEAHRQRLKSQCLTLQTKFPNPLFSEYLIQNIPT